MQTEVSPGPCTAHRAGNDWRSIRTQCGLQINQEGKIWPFRHVTKNVSSQTRLPVLRMFSSGLDHRSYFSVTVLESNFLSRPSVVIISASTMVKK